MKRYRVWVHIRGSVVKSSQDGYIDVWADDEDDAFIRAIRQARTSAHWDSPVDAFRLVRVEVIG